MRTRLRFASESSAQTFAASVHSRMISSVASYAVSAARGQTLRWAIPYQDEGDTTNWYINVKDRCNLVLTAQERSLVVNGTLPGARA